jgi:exodeoxyribonuclease III
MTRIISYNVNGIRAALNKGLDQWIKSSAPDILCLQEIKANEDQIDVSVFTDMGYHCFWFSAQKKGYSGTAILTKKKPLNVSYGMENELYDFEGRVIRADFENYSVISVYMPSGSSGDLRQEFKIQFLEDFQNYINTLKLEIPNLIIVGDYNICHQAIDIHNPLRNKKTSGFLPEERQWLSDFIASGFVDSFRYFNSDPHHYSWWSYRANARAKNLGWRIDYLMVSKSLEEKLSRGTILSEAKHSDHCPILLEIEG